MSLSKEITKISLDIGAIKFNTENPFLWASGFYMPIYNDNRLLLGNVKNRLLIAEGFKASIKNNNISMDVVAGTATAGIAPATSLANIMEKPLIYVRPTPKDHGIKNQIEGILFNNQKVVVIEDLISTGGSAIKVINSIRNAGGIVEHCLCIFSYGFEKAIDSFKNANCQLHQLVEFQSLISTAKENSYLSDEKIQMLQNWHNDPFNWWKKKDFTSE